jgi:hypothetical protein
MRFGGLQVWVVGYFDKATVEGNASFIWCNALPEEQGRLFLSGTLRGSSFAPHGFPNLIVVGA